MDRGLRSSEFFGLHISFHRGYSVIQHPKKVSLEMSTLGILLTMVGAFAFLSVAASIVVAIQTFKNRIIATDEITHIRFYQEVVLIFISIFFLLIPFLVGQAVSWVSQRGMRKRLEFNLAVIHCCTVSNIGSWTLRRKPQLRSWYEAEPVLHRNRWRVE